MLFDEQQYVTTFVTEVRSQWSDGQRYAQTVPEARSSDRKTSAYLAQYGWNPSSQ